MTKIVSTWLYGLAQSAFWLAAGQDSPPEQKLPRAKALYDAKQYSAALPLFQQLAKDASDGLNKRLLRVTRLPCSTSEPCTKRGIAQDPAAAKDWYARAAEAGYQPDPK